MAGKATTRSLSRAGLIAPCGMNCGVCFAFLRQRHPCPGCRVDDPRKPKTRRGCRIRNCAESRGRFCAGCARFPCARLSHLDERYHRNYGMSMIENLRRIKTGGLQRFVEQERARWACPGCGATLCVHQAACPACARPWR